MTTERHSAIPALTLGWRLKMALAHGGVKAGTMAEQLGYESSTLSRWMSDKGTPPRKGVIQQWALATNVSPEWLETGEGDPTPSGPDGTPGEPDREAALARLAAKKRRHAAGGGTHRYSSAA
jgi:transcriptional regulator with XRE-family HTH domain